MEIPPIAGSNIACIIICSCTVKHASRKDVECHTVKRIRHTFANCLSAAPWYTVMIRFSILFLNSAPLSVVLLISDIQDIEVQWRTIVTGCTADYPNCTFSVIAHQSAFSHFFMFLPSVSIKSLNFIHAEAKFHSFSPSETVVDTDKTVIHTRNQKYWPDFEPASFFS